MYKDKAVKCCFNLLNHFKMNYVIKLISKIKLKLFLDICKDAWKDSKTVVSEDLAKYRLLIFIDMLFSLLLFGADSADYRIFEFYNMNFRGRNAYITRIRNTKLRLWTSEEAFELFDNKGLFNIRFSKFISRGWISTKSKSSLDILDFINKYKTVIVKPSNGTWGIGVYKLNDLEKKKLINLLRK